MDSRKSPDDELLDEVPEESTKSIWLVDADPVGGIDMLIEDGPWSGVKSTLMVGIWSLNLLFSEFWDIA